MIVKTKSIEETSRWSFISKNAMQHGIALKIYTALHTIEENNSALKGALPDNYFSRLDIDKTKLASLIDKINEINTIEDGETDKVGRVGEYCLKKIAINEGKGESYISKTTTQHIEDIGRTFYQWRYINTDILEYCYATNKREVAKRDYSFVPSIDRDEDIDFDTEMKRIKQDFKTLLQEEKDSQNQFLNAFKTLDYEIR